MVQAQDLRHGAPFGPFRETPARCLHCGLPVESPTDGAFCCTGCEAVYGLLHAEHFDAYYDLRGPRGVPIADRRPERRDAKWLEVLEETLRRSPETHSRLVLDLQGLHGAACVWLIEKIFARAAGGERIVVNPSVGRV